MGLALNTRPLDSTWLTLGDALGPAVGTTVDEPLLRVTLPLPQLLLRGKHSVSVIHL